MSQILGDRAQISQILEDSSQIKQILEDAGSKILRDRSQISQILEETSQISQMIVEEFKAKRSAPPTNSAITLRCKLINTFQYKRKETKDTVSNIFGNPVKKQTQSRDFFFFFFETMRLLRAENQSKAIWKTKQSKGNKKTEVLTLK